MVAKIHGVGTRLQALCMLENRCKLADIIRDTDTSQSSIYRLRQEALKRGYDKDASRKLLLSYIADRPRSGRPIKATEEVAEQVISVVMTNLTTRELSAQAISDKLPPILRVSRRIVHCILRSRSYKLLKPIYKPGLKNKDILLTTAILS
jgi:hypothetical protein